MQRPLNRVNACTARIVCTVRFRHGEIHIFQLGRVLASRVPLRPAIGGKATLSRQRSIVRFGRSTVNERILAARSELVGDSVETRAEAVTPRSLLFVDLFRVARFRMAAVVQLDLPGAKHEPRLRKNVKRVALYSRFCITGIPSSASFSCVHEILNKAERRETRSRITNTDRENSRG